MKEDSVKETEVSLGVHAACSDIIERRQGGLNPLFEYIIYDMAEACDFTIFIQAGGQSSRMGTDKALLPFLGQPLISRQLARLRSSGQNAFGVEVITNRPEEYGFLNVPLHMDLLPGVGPLGGLYTALQVCSTPLAAVIACDMPFVQPMLLLAQRDLLLSENADVVIPRVDGKLEPLHAAYRVSSCLPAARAALEMGERKMIAWFGAVRVREMTGSEIGAVDPGFRSFINLNSPDEFRRAEDEALQLEDD